MIIIHKEASTQRLIVTVSENNPNPNPSYTLKLHSTYSNKDFSIILPSNSSEFQDRYDAFILSGQDLSPIEPGTYLYTIVDTNSANKVCEQGMSKVVSNSLTEQQQVALKDVSLAPDASEEDFLVYNPEDL